MAINKKLRFEIFKRDEFTCQYCGKEPPDALLEVDHIIPRKENGGDEEENLITSCRDCNQGKSGRMLNEIKFPKAKNLKKRNDEIKEREDQLREYYELIDERRLRISDDLDFIDEKYQELKSGYQLNDNGRREYRTLLRTFGKFEIIEAMEIADAQRSKFSGDERGYQEFRYTCGILWKRKRAKEAENEEEKWQEGE